ncbi:MAG: Uma2 family endonuclease, partial [Myxococcota bacterium]
MASGKEGPTYYMAGDGGYGGSGYGGGMSARGAEGGGSGLSVKRKAKESRQEDAASSVGELERVALKPVSLKRAESGPVASVPVESVPVSLAPVILESMAFVQPEGLEEAELPPPVIPEWRLFSGERLELDMMYQLEGRYTLEAFHALQERLELLEGVISRVELIDGDVFVSTSAREPHAVAISNLMISLSLWVRRQKLGTVYTVFGLLLDPQTEVIPDLFYVTEEELARCEEKGVRGAASLVVEVLSPSTAHVDRNRKKKKYEEVGVGEYWLVDVKRQQVEVWGGSVVGEGWKRRLWHGEDVLTTACLPGWSLPLAAVFDRMWVHEDPEAVVIAAGLNAAIEEQKERVAALEAERTRAEA